MITCSTDKKIPTLSYALFKNHPHVVHAVTTRLGGISKSPCQSLNFGFLAEDSPAAVIDNRIRLCQAIGASPRALTIGEQVHGDRVVVVGENERGGGALDLCSRLPRTDAMITQLPRTPLMVLIADCAAVGIYDPVQRAVGMAHAGWRGTAAGIAGKMVAAMAAAFGSRPEDMLAGISPSIGPCCYEVGEEVIAAFEKSFPESVDAFFLERRNGRARLDLWRANRRQLIEAGVRSAHLEAAGRCTSCQTDLFYSHRAEGGRTGRFGAVIILK
jgi:YfiH family protein